MNQHGTKWLIIDGYSLLHRHPDLVPTLKKDLGLARQLLIREIESVANHMAPRTTVVFDGRTQGGQGDLIHTSLEICFAPGHLTADTVIERLVCADPEPARMLVVTSDRAERDTVAASGADTMSCGDFLDRCRSHRDRLAARHAPPKRKRGATLGDFFP